MNTQRARSIRFPILLISYLLVLAPMAVPNIASAAEGNIEKVLIWADGNELLVQIGENLERHDLSKITKIKYEFKKSTDLRIEASVALPVEITGSEERDVIRHDGTGPATVNGMGGNDEIHGGRGKDTIHGNAGNDVIHGGADSDGLFGDDGDDELVGDEDDDSIEGGEGSDKASGGRGNDRIHGMSGNDLLRGEEGNDLLIGGDGNDELSGGKGSDTVFGGQLAEWEKLDAIAARVKAGMPQSYREPYKCEGIVTANVDKLFGGEDDDVIIGDTGDDFLSGESGTDYLYGGMGNDELHGGDFVDRLWGGPGDDKMFGGKSSDELVGGPGNDLICSGVDKRSTETDQLEHWLVGDEWEDEQRAGKGNGKDLVFADEAGPCWIYAGHGDNVIQAGSGMSYIYAGNGSDSVEDKGGKGKNQIWLGNGNNHVVIKGNDEDEVRCGNGNDHIQDEGGIAFIDAGLGANVVHVSSKDKSQGKEAVVFAGIESIALDDRSLSNETNWKIRNNNFATERQIVNVFSSSNSKALIVTGNGDDQIVCGTSHDTVFSHDGQDSIVSSDGNNRICSGPGNDNVSCGAGNDVVVGGIGADTISSGSGRDFVSGDVLPSSVPGTTEATSLTSFQWFDQHLLAQAATTFPAIPVRFLPRVANEDLESRFELTLKIVPRIFASDSFHGGDDTQDDDKIDGGKDDDWLLGGAGNDLIVGDVGHDYIDGGSGQDQLFGDAEKTGASAGDADVILGGRNDDFVFAGGGLDQVYGGDGNDTLKGEAADTEHVGNVTAEATIELEVGGSIKLKRPTQAQRLWGEDGEDILHAYAKNQEENALWGDELYGGNGNDYLYGNQRKDLLVGGNLVAESGDGPDYLHGDYHNGQPENNPAEDVSSGADDILFGDLGSDQLYGGGGTDHLFGGEDNDWLEGMDGDDKLFGGSAPDLLIADVDSRYLSSENDYFDGHGRNRPGDTKRDDAVDILVVLGDRSYEKDAAGKFLSDPNKKDRIELRNSHKSQNSLVICYRGKKHEAQWLTRDANKQPVPLVEQFQVQGLMENDTIRVKLPDEVIGILSAKPEDGSISFDTLEMARPWLTTITGGPGDDTIHGSNGRDYVDGGEGSDSIFGNAGDDRLRGGDGKSDDKDALYAGPGNDDLFGGSGTNLLSAWTNFPSFDKDKSVPNIDKEEFKKGQSSIDTGVNRMLGGSGDDHLFGGTGIDLLHGNGGNDVLYGKDGDTFQNRTADGSEITQWVEYAKSTNRCWYIGGSDGVDKIDLNFVTNPRNSLFGRHVATFKARGSFEPFVSGIDRLLAYAVDGGPVHDDRSYVRMVDEKKQRNTKSEQPPVVGETQFFPSVDTPRRDLQRETDGDAIDDVLAIVIDTAGGDDEVLVGETVQKTVWITTGAGNDTAQLEPQRSFLPDNTELGDKIADAPSIYHRNDSRSAEIVEVKDWQGTHRFESKPFPLHRLFDKAAKAITQSCVIGNLTIDSARNAAPDNDWYELILASDLAIHPGDSLRIVADAEAPLICEVYVPESTSDSVVQFQSTSQGDFQLASTQWLDLDKLPDAIKRRFLLKVYQKQSIPTSYQIELRFAATQDRMEAKNAPYDFGIVNSNRRVSGLTLHENADKDTFTFELPAGTDADTIKIEVKDSLGNALRFDGPNKLESQSKDTAKYQFTIGNAQPCAYEVAIAAEQQSERQLANGVRTTFHLRDGDQPFSILRRASLFVRVELVDLAPANTSVGGEPKPIQLTLDGLAPVEIPTTTQAVEIPLTGSAISRQLVVAQRPPERRRDYLRSKTLRVIDSRLLDLRNTRINGGIGATEQAELDALGALAPVLDVAEMFKSDGAPATRTAEHSDDAQALLGALNASCEGKKGKPRFEFFGGRLAIAVDEAFTVEGSLATLLGFDDRKSKVMDQLPRQVTISAANIPSGARLHAHIRTDAPVVRQEDLAFDPSDQRNVVDARNYDLFPLLSRRDAIFGGDGNDRLLGGSGEDWIFGGDGNDVLCGGMDRQASDVIHGGNGKDLFQIVTDRWPILPSTRREGDPAHADELDGGDGLDRIVYLGGDEVPRSADLPRHYIRDFVMLGYDRFLARYRIASVPWNIARTDGAKSQDAVSSSDNKKTPMPGFLKRTDGTNAVFYAYFQTKKIEGTLVDTRGGMDIIHADPGYYFKPSGQSWGISLGDVQAGAEAYRRIELRGGDGADLIFGSSGSDTIYGQHGPDIIVGGDGDDRILGGHDADFIFGKSEKRVAEIGAEDRVRFYGELLASIKAETPDGATRDPSNARLDLAHVYPSTLDHTWPSDELFGERIGTDLAKHEFDEKKPQAILDNAFKIELPAGESVKSIRHSEEPGEFLIDTETETYKLVGPITPERLFRYDVREDFDENSPGRDVKVIGRDWSYIMSAASQNDTNRILRYHQLPLLAANRFRSQQNVAKLERYHSAGDFNGDGTKDRIQWADPNLVLQIMNGPDFKTELYRLEGEVIVASVCRLGDVNQDGCDDVAVVVDPKISQNRFAEFLLLLGDGKAKHKKFEEGADANMLVFSRVWGKAGVATMRTLGLAGGDYNGDGRIDLLVLAQIEGARSELYVNLEFSRIAEDLIKLHKVPNGIIKPNVNRPFEDEVQSKEWKRLAKEWLSGEVAPQHVRLAIANLNEVKIPAADRSVDLNDDGFHDIVLIRSPQDKVENTLVTLFGSERAGFRPLHQPMLTNLDLPGAVPRLVELPTGDVYSSDATLQGSKFYKPYEYQENTPGTRPDERPASRMPTQLDSPSQRQFWLRKIHDSAAASASVCLQGRHDEFCVGFVAQAGANFNLQINRYDMTIEANQKLLPGQAVIEYRAIVHGETVSVFARMPSNADWVLIEKVVLPDWRINAYPKHANETATIKMENKDALVFIGNFFIAPLSNWYRFSTSGDGQIGDFVSVTGRDNAFPSIKRLYEASVKTIQGQQGDRAEFLFDLSRLHDGRAPEIKNANLLITLTAENSKLGSGKVVNIWLVGESEDEAYPRLLEFQLGESTSGNDFRISSDELSTRVKTELRNLIRRGFTVAKVIVKPKYDGTWNAIKCELKVGLQNEPGVVADLYTQDGKLVRKGRSLLDLRNAKAGDYLLRISDPLMDLFHPRFDSNYIREKHVNYRLAIQAPKLGDFHPATDADEIFGEEGDDILVGNDGRDRLIGGYGNDLFVGEEVEAKDNESGNQFQFPPTLQKPTPGATAENSESKVPPTSGETIKDTIPFDRDPVLMRFAGDTSVISSHGLGHAIAQELDLANDLKNEKGNLVKWILKRPIRASDMAELLSLRVDREHQFETAAVGSLQGLDFAINLRTLVAANCGVTDISALRPDVRTTIGQLDPRSLPSLGTLGCAQLHTVVLDDNGGLVAMGDEKNATEVGAIDTLADLKRLKLLSINQSLNSTSVSALQPLFRLVELRTLNANRLIARPSSVSQKGAVSLPSLEASPELQYLRFANRDLTDVTTLPNSKSLIELNVRNNRIKQIHPAWGVISAGDEEHLHSNIFGTRINADNGEKEGYFGRDYASTRNAYLPGTENLTKDDVCVYFNFKGFQQQQPTWQRIDIADKDHRLVVKPPELDAFVVAPVVIKNKSLTVFDGRQNLIDNKFFEWVFTELNKSQSRQFLFDRQQQK